jgi:hypothetical protein
MAVMPFETFRRQRTRPGEPSLTIQRKGVFSLNREAFEALGRPEAVELLYDPDERLIGVRNVDSSADHSYQVRGMGRRSATWLVSGTAFTNYYGIDTSVSTRRVARIENELLIVDLKDPGVQVTSNRMSDEY